MAAINLVNVGGKSALFLHSPKALPCIGPPGSGCSAGHCRGVNTHMVPCKKR